MKALEEGQLSAAESALRALQAYLAEEGEDCETNGECNLLKTDDSMKPLVEESE